MNQGQDRGGSYEGPYGDRYSGNHPAPRRSGRGHRRTASSAPGSGAAHKQTGEARASRQGGRRVREGSSTPRFAEPGSQPDRGQQRHRQDARREQLGRAAQGYAPMPRSHGRQKGSSSRRRGPAVPGMKTIVGAIVVVVIVAAAVFAWNTRPVDIKLNGSTTSVKVGSSLEAIISSKRLSPKTGDLISVGGNVLQQGQGYKFSASVNGQDIDPDDAASYRAADGDDITIGDGENRYEEYDVDIVEEQPKLEMGGDAWGNITYISQWPKVGKHEVRHGKTSGETADGDVLQQTQN